MWNQLYPTLSKIHTKTLDDVEKAFGIVDIKSSPGIILRNWLGYKLREKILSFERSAYRQSRTPSADQFRAKFNQSVAKDVKILMHRLNNEGNLSKFDDIVAYKGIVCERKSAGEYKLKKVFE